MKRPRILQSVLEIPKHISIIEMQWKSFISMFVGISHPSTNNKEGITWLTTVEPEDHFSKANQITVSKQAFCNQSYLSPFKTMHSLLNLLFSSSNLIGLIVLAV